jgi:hypothetical protein
VREGGRVVAHVDAACLRDVTLHVSVAGVARVQRQGQREVVAFARGVLCEAHRWSSVQRVIFDPFDGAVFTLANGTPVLTAHLLFLDADGSAWAVL